MNNFQEMDPAFHLLIRFPHCEEQPSLEATSLKRGDNLCYLLCFFFSDQLPALDFTSRCIFQKKKRPFPVMLAISSWNPIIREPAMQLEWLMVMENINRLNGVRETHMNIIDLLYYSMERLHVMKYHFMFHNVFSDKVSWHKESTN